MRSMHLDGKKTVQISEKSVMLLKYLIPLGIFYVRQFSVSEIRLIEQK